MNPNRRRIARAARLALGASLLAGAAACVPDAETRGAPASVEPAPRTATERAPPPGEPPSDAPTLGARPDDAWLRQLQLDHARLEAAERDEDLFDGAEGYDPGAPTSWDTSPWRDLLVASTGSVELPHHPHLPTSWDTSSWRDLLVDASRPPPPAERPTDRTAVRIADRPAGTSPPRGRAEGDGGSPTVVASTPSAADPLPASEPGGPPAVRALVASWSVGANTTAPPVGGGLAASTPGSAAEPTAPGDASPPRSIHRGPVPALPRAPHRDAVTGEQAPLRVMVISDLNSSYGSTEYRSEVYAAVERILEVRPDLVLCTGDMVAGQRRGLNYHAMWDAFHEAVTRPLAEAGIPFAITPGNHDASAYTRFEGERAIFVERWQEWKPDLDFLDDTDWPLRYSFAFGNALFVSLDDTVLGPLSDDDMAWLDHQLATYGPRYPTRIVFGHVPLYPLAEGRDREARNDPRFEDLLNLHEVQMFISGHHHTYYPGRRGPLRLLAMACVGNGNRFLAGTLDRSLRSMAEFWLDEHGGIHHLEAFAGRTFDQLVPRWSLPLSVPGGGHRIWRDDLFNMPLD